MVRSKVGSVLRKRMKKKATNTQKLSHLQRFGLFFFGRRETTITFWIAAVVFGITCYTTLMQRQGFPSVDVPVSVVSGTYLVNDKAKVDADITKPASEVVARLPVVKSVSSQAGDNFFYLAVQYKDGTSSAEGSSAVSEALTSAKVFPPAAKVSYKPIDASRFAEQSDMLLSVSSDNTFTIAELQARAASVATEIRKASGVEKAVVLTQIEEGTNPVTGEKATVQRSFDRIGYHDASGAVVFKNSVIIGIQAKPSTDALELYDEIENKIDDLKHADGYDDLKITISADFAEGIRSQIENLQSSLLEGLIVVIIVSCLLISWRAGLATALSMATVLLLTIAALYASGTTLNTITLFALILSLGLIVDDTTIMVEAIDAAGKRESDKRIVVAQAIKRVARASFSGTLVTMLAFAPMIFISGVLGDFIRILPISIIVALAVSLLVSLSLVPFFARFLVHKEKKGPLRNPVARAEQWISTKLSDHVRSSGTSRRKRLLYGGVAILISLTFFLGSLPYFKRLKFDIFPSTKDANELTVVLTYPDNSSIAQASETAAKADIIIGDTLGKYLRKLTYQSTGSATDVTMDLQLTPYTDREVSSQQFITDLQEAFREFQGARVKVSQVDVGPPKDDYPFAVRIYEDDAKKALVLAKDMDKYLNGREVTRLNGTTARISRLQESNQAFIVRSDGKQYVQLSAGFDATDTSALLNPAKKVVEDHYTDEELQKVGIKKSQLDFDFGNEENNQDSFKSMVLAFPILLAVMYVLLLFQFRSFLQPLLIFIALHFSFSGVAAGLYYSDNPLSFFVLVGFFALIGIAVNNTILLTDFANQVKDTGASKYDAVAQAVAARFRPLIATSLTSFVALIPLAISDPFWQSLAITLMFGLLSSTLLVIVSFPYFYLISEWLRGCGVKWWRRELAQPWQIIFDIILSPVRLLRFVFWVIFSWPKRTAKAILK